MIITDIWEKCRDNNTHFILTGDFIHAMGRKDDRSIEILESVKKNWEKYENFYPFLVTTNGPQYPGYRFLREVSTSH